MWLCFKYLKAIKLVKYNVWEYDIFHEKDVWFNFKRFWENDSETKKCEKLHKGFNLILCT